ncbi:MAG TPA: hypothetical protein VLE73_02490 [Candidatus Saccharimonadales bacterium]|nr:hypothetical protein [Candidatus Saccharimonadales bacterium]
MQKLTSLFNKGVVMKNTVSGAHGESGASGRKKATQRKRIGA